MLQHWREGRNEPLRFHLIPFTRVPFPPALPQLPAPAFAYEPPSTRCPFNRNTLTCSSTVATAIRSMVGQYASVPGLHFTGNPFSAIPVRSGGGSIETCYIANAYSLDESRRRRVFAGLSHSIRGWPVICRTVVANPVVGLDLSVEKEKKNPAAMWLLAQ